MKEPDAGSQPESFSREVQMLAKRGLIKPEGMTPREFTHLVAAARGSDYGSITEITASFEKVRYGGMPLTPEEVTSINDGLGEIRKG